MTAAVVEDRCVHEMLIGTCAICMKLEVKKPRLPSAEVRASQLFDYAAGLQRWTKRQVCEELCWSDGAFQETVRMLRGILAGDTINLVVNYEDGDHYYKLVGDLDSAMPWATVRLHSVESQLNTIADVTKSICNATDRNTMAGRKARMIAAQVNILQMQLATVEN